MEKSFAQRDLFLEEIKQNKRDLFSFVYDEKKFLSSQLEHSIVNTQKDKKKDIIEILWHLAGTGINLTLKFSVFTDFPYLEYSSFLHNPGTADSDIISDLKMLELKENPETPYYGNMTLQKLQFSHAGNRVKISYYLGSFCSAHDFIRIDKRLCPQPGEDTLCLNGENFSRPSERALPFFRVDLDDLNGYDIGVGWSGSWRADFSLKSNTTPGNHMQMGREFTLCSGMSHSRFYVKPGETLRAPGYFIGFRNGIKVRDFINIHRRFMMTHHAPHDSKGAPLLPPLCVNSWGGVETENMKKILRLVKEKDLPFEVHWIDAGWQGHDGPCPHFAEDPQSDWPQRVGSNRINGYAHPKGLSEITDFARECGLKTMVWFEPERYYKKCGDPLLKEHPDWFLENSGSNYILDLGNPEACEWLIKWLLDFLEKERIEFYRQDQNINMQPIWRECDAPDRIGVLEMKHINNLYKVWSALRTARPDMYIDNCASGGRRLDYMLATYSFPLCQSDYETFADYNYSCVHLENYYLNEVYPIHGTLSWMPDGDSYAILSGGCGMGIGSKRWNFPSRYPQDDFDYDTYRKHLLVIREMRSLMARGNYYQLSRSPEDLSEFCAMQAHDPEKNEGYVILFRRPETEDEEFIALLQEIDPEAVYEIRDFMTDDVTKVSGREFRYFRRSMPERRTVSLQFYKKL